MAKEKTQDGWRWAEVTERFPDDEMLRAHGYTILIRKGKEEPIWEDATGKQVSQKAAMRTVRRIQREVQKCASS